MSSLTLTHTHYFSKNKQTKERGKTNWKYKIFPPKNSNHDTQKRNKKNCLLWWLNWNSFTQNKTHTHADTHTNDSFFFFLITLKKGGRGKGFNSFFFLFSFLLQNNFKIIRPEWFRRYGEFKNVHTAVDCVSVINSIFPLSILKWKFT